MGERILSTRELNRALLARQMLLERSTKSIPAAIDQMGGLQTQYAPSAYIGLWSRLRGFHRDSLTKALEQRRVIQATLMRSTIHMVSKRDFWPLVAAIKKDRRDWWLRVNRSEMEGVDMAAAVRLVRRHLRGGPLRQKEIADILAAAGFPKIAWSAAGLWLDLVRVPPSGTWEKRRADLYGLADAWVGEGSVTESEGLERLLRRYLGGFGPASLADAAKWAGLPAAKLAKVAEKMLLSHFRSEEDTELVDLPRAPRPDPDTPAPPRFIPTWDATLLVHARRTQILPEEYRVMIFDTKTPHSLPTFLIDGAVAGTWRYERGKIRLDSLRRLGRTERHELEEEAERLEAWHED